MSNPHEYLPDVATVAPITLAREAVLHHAGANGLAVHYPDAAPGSCFETRELYPPEQPTPAPWVADDHPEWAQPTLELRTSGGRSIVWVSMTPDGARVRTVGMCGKAEIEWANAALIARMREREPLIATECIRLDTEARSLRAEAADLRDKMAEHSLVVRAHDDSEAENERLRAIVAKLDGFADHRHDCGIHQADADHSQGHRGYPGDAEDCTCGLAALRTEIAELADP